MQRWSPLAGVMLLLACAGLGRAEVHRKRAWVADHGLKPKAYPKYLGKGRGLGWQDLYNQDDTGAYYLEREFEFRNTRLDLRITQAYIGDTSHPTGRLGLRYPKGHRPVTPTQPEWLSTWCRYDDIFPGLLDVVIGDKGLEGVAPTFHCGTEGAIAFVRCEWVHEPGRIAATFLMLPDDDRLFCEVAVTPKQRDVSVSVSLCCWPMGNFVARTASGTSAPLRYDETHGLPPGDRTVLLTDPTFDPAGKSKHGTCALTYLPDECVRATVLRRSPAFVTLHLPPAAEKSTLYAHFVLWELLQRRADGAFAYVMQKEADTVAQFGSLAGIADPKLAKRRENEIKRVEKEIRATDSNLRRLDGPDSGLRTSPGGSWAVFHRDEAFYHLSSGDWLRASSAATKAQQAVKVLLPGSR